MIYWLVRRVAAGVLAALAAFVLVFSLLRVVPGDPIDIMLGERAQPARADELRRVLGLELSWQAQIARDLKRLSHGDLGESVTMKRPVRALVAERVGPTLALAGAALAVALLISLPLGLASGWRPGSNIDRFGRLVAALGIGMPTFWLGPLLLLVFAVHLSWLPLGGYRSYSALVLPALTLGFGLAALQARMLRASLVETKASLFIVAARAKGAGERRLLLRHALRPSALPAVTVLGLQLGALLSGAVITETIFQWPGIGRLLIESVQARDYPTVQGVVVVFTGIYVAVNTLVDIAYGWLDPRLGPGGA